MAISSYKPYGHYFRSTSSFFSPIQVEAYKAIECSIPNKKNNVHTV